MRDWINKYPLLQQDPAQLPSEHAPHLLLVSRSHAASSAEPGLDWHLVILASSGKGVICCLDTRMNSKSDQK